ncbi:MAG: MarR family winged helix-turn-helix transcriptional regulator [Nakamurella sp.]
MTIRWLDQDEERAWRGYRQLRALLDLQISRDLAHAAQLSDADYDVLSDLSETDGHRLRLIDLAGRMLWSKSRLAHHIDRMENRGLVRREGDPTVSRGVWIALAPAGLLAIENAAPGHVASVRSHFIDLLTAEQLSVLGDVAEIVVTHLQAVREPAALAER